MKNYLILLVMLTGILPVSRLKAQLYQGDKTLHFHIGYTGRWYKYEKYDLTFFNVDSVGYARGSTEGITAITVPMLEGGYSWMFNDKWGAGFNLGYTSSVFEFNGWEEVGDNSGGNSAYMHITLESYNVFVTPFARWYFYNEYKFQSYLTAKVHFGLYFFNFNLTKKESSSAPVYFHLFLPFPDVQTSLMIGANYFPAEHFGVFLEAGYGKSYVNLGVVYKL